MIEIKSINANKHPMSSILILNDNRIAYSSNEKYAIKILNPNKNYQCDASLTGHSNFVNSITQLNDNNIASCSNDHSIKIWSITSYKCLYTISNGHRSYVLKVISLPLNRIATCAGSSEIKIWNTKPPYSDTPIKVLEGHSDSVISLLYIKERDIMLSSSRDDTLHLWNMSTYQCDKVIEGVYCYFTNSLYQIDKDRVIVGGKKSFSIVNIDKCIIEKRIVDESLEYVRCFLKLRDNKTILCGCNNGIFCFYDMNTEQYKITNDNHHSSITDLLLIDDNTFLSCSRDSTIKVWRY